MWYFSIFRNVKLLFFTVPFLLYGLSAKAQQDIDTTRLSAVSFFGDTTALKMELEDLSSFRLSDEELRIFIMRTLRHGSPEISTLKDPFFARTEQFYGLFDAQRTLLSTNELMAIKNLNESLNQSLQRELDDNKKAAKAGTIYWILQWLLIFL